VSGDQAPVTPEALAAGFDELASKVASRDAEGWDIAMRAACDATAASLSDCATKVRDVLVPAWDALTADLDTASRRLAEFLAVYDRYKADEVSAAGAWGDVGRLVEGIPEREAPDPRVRLGRCVTHAGEEHVMVNTAGHWLCMLALRGLDDGWREIDALITEYDREANAHGRYADLTEAPVASGNAAGKSAVYRRCADELRAILGEARADPGGRRVVDRRRRPRAGDP
jgi:hypothetical protein